MLRIAICDDDKRLLEVLEREVRSWAKERQEICSVELFITAEAFLFAWEEKKDMDVLLLDIEMPKLNGIETFERMKEFAPNMPVIFLTASGLEEDVRTAIRLGAVNYLMKPFQPQELMKRIAQEFEKQ